MVKALYVDKDGLRKGAWTEEEDTKLRAYIDRYGHWNWRLLPKFADLQRCGKSCRLRWVNYLKPGVKRGVLSQEERDVVAKLHQQLGNKYDFPVNPNLLIFTKLPGRSDNDIKNYWQTHLQKGEKSSKCGQVAEISKEKRPPRIRHRKNMDEYSSTGSDVTCVGPNMCKLKRRKSCDLFILESSSCSSVASNTAFEWDLNL